MLGGPGSRDPFEPRDGGLVAGADVLELERLPADGQHRLAGEVVDAATEQLQFDLAAHAMRPGDRGQRNALHGHR